MTDPFFLPPQSVLSFSGGRTSGYMLRRHLDAHGGSLPADRVAVFCNTGKEREETLQFVERCSLEWGVPIRWLEYRWEPGRHYFEEVNYATASRNGEPFMAAIRARGAPGWLPNPIARTCTIELKLLTTWRFAQSLGWAEYANAVGLRADEPARVLRLRRRKAPPRAEQGLFGEITAKRNRDITPGERPLCPLFDAGTKEADVLAFWAAQPFDLALPPGEGMSNCDLCFLKGAAVLVNRIRERPDLADWWAAQEAAVGATFRNDRPPYAELKQIATGDITGPGWLWADKGNTGACGEADECRCTD